MDIPVAPASKGVSSLSTFFLGFLGGGLIVGGLLLGTITQNNSDAIPSTALSDLPNGIFSLSDVDLASISSVDLDFLDESNQNLEVDGFLRKEEASDLESLVFYFNNNPEYHSLQLVRHNDNTGEVTFHLSFHDDDSESLMVNNGPQNQRRRLRIKWTDRLKRRIEKLRVYRDAWYALPQLVANRVLDPLDVDLHEITNYLEDFESIAGSMTTAVDAIMNLEAISSLQPGDCLPISDVLAIEAQARSFLDVQSSQINNISGAMQGLIDDIVNLADTVTDIMNGGALPLPVDSQ